MGSDAALDPRLNAYLPELADVRLRGRVEARTFAEGSLKQVRVGVAPLKRMPASEAPLESQMQRGETVRAFGETANGWCFCQSETDGYVGFVPGEALDDRLVPPTHRVTALRTFLYPVPDLKVPARDTLPIGSLVAVEGEMRTRGTPYGLLAGSEGAIVMAHLEPVAAPLPEDHVSVAERFVETPYLWGGRTSLGADCSGFVQLVLGLTGRKALRDTDLLAAHLGDPVDGGLEGDLRRGDVVIWKGHALIIRDAGTVIHSSGQHMRVVIEPSSEAFRRLLAAVGQPLAVRRPGPPEPPATT